MKRTATKLEAIKESGRKKRGRWGQSGKKEIGPEGRVMQIDERTQENSRNVWTQEPTRIRRLRIAEERRGKVIVVILTTG